MLKALFLAVLAANILLLVSSTDSTGYDVTSSSSNTSSSSSSKSSSSSSSTSSSSSFSATECDGDDETIDDDDDLNQSCGGDPNAKPGCGQNCGRRCSNFNKGPVPCAKICKVGGCDCKPNYVFDDNIEKCVLPSQCTPVCGANQTYAECPDLTQPRNCSQVGYPLPFPTPSQDGNCPKKPACVCLQGYVKNDKGICVSQKECPSCGGDPNAEPGCGQNCGRRCSNYNKNPVVCPAICQLNACDCKPAFVFDDNLKKCVSPKECTPQCKVNEVFSNCTQAECRATSCKDRNRPIACPLIAAGSCKKGCVCQPNYYRANNGTCIPEGECDSAICPDGGQYNTCPAAKCDADNCPKDRNSPQSCISTRNCGEPRCTCGFNQKRNRKTGKCVAIAKCPPFKCDGPNEEYQACPPVCPGQNCSDYINNSTCPKFGKIGITVPCQPQCRCKENFYRNSEGICVQGSQCKKEAAPTGCRGDPNAEQIKGCGSGCRKSCSNYKRFKDLICPDVCRTGCDCKPGYVYDDAIKKCVLPKDCTPTCGLNEVFSECTQGVCRNQDCTQKGKPVACPGLTPGSCKKGCVCQENYLRAKNGTCVPENQCPEEPTSCKGDPNAIPGCGVNCGRLCSNYDSPDPVACILICYLDACDCKKDYVFDSNTGKCVLPTECTPQCKLNEVFSNCTQGDCRATSCKDRNSPIACPIIAAGSCKKGCVCQSNYYRADNGTCIPESECDGPTPQCTVNEVVSNCTQADCRATFCKDRNMPIACPLIVEGSCKKGCVCQPNYYRADNGTCIPESECDGPTPQCTVNEVVSNCTQAECRATFCKDRNMPIACRLIVEGSCKKGCVCQPNYYRADNGTCIPESECDGPTPQCTVNEVVSNCPYADCRATFCKDRNRPIACPLIVGGSCKKGCVCQPNYYRADNGTCIPESECDSAICPDGGQYNTCPAAKCDAEYCPKDRNSPQSCISTRNCGEPRCTCGFNQKRNRKTGKCVAIAKCPPFKCDGPNEEYQACPPVCPGQNCSDYKNNSTCPKFLKIGIAVTCEPQCRCKENFYRNSEGICVQGSQCKKEEKSTEPKEDPEKTEEASETVDAQKRFSKGVNNLTIRFFNEVINSKKDENVIMSPFSVTVPLAQLGLRTKGNSNKQLLRILNLVKEDIPQVFRALLNSFKSVKDVEFALAAKVYANDKYPLSEDYLNESKKIFDAEAENIDCSNSSKSADIINKYIELITNNRIKDLVTPDMITRLTRLVLVNAIYFKGLWKTQFNRNNTQDRDFHVNKVKTIRVPTMYQKAKFRYTESEELGAQILQMPYRNENFTCTIILPTDKYEDLAITASKLTPDNLNKAMNSMRSQEVKAYIPRFKIETTIDLKDILQKLGLTDIFNTKNSGIDGILKIYEPVYVSAAKQKAFVEVNEEGSEATAANVFTGVRTTSVRVDPPREITFIADHPFFFLINYQSDSLFCGAYRKQ